MKYDFDLELVNNNSLLLILQQIKKNSVILEFGPANGRLTKYLKNELQCDVYLAEIDEQAGKEALQYGKDLVIGDVEEFAWFDRYHELRFDYILFADILEHLRDPKKVLERSKLLLKQQGSILVSVPNMAHNSVMIQMMNNELKYNSVGLLDNTHIHIFTYHSLERMVKECDLYPCKRMGTYCEVGKNEIPNSIYDVAGISPQYWNGRQYGEVYQFVYELKKGKEYMEEELNLLNPYYQHYWLQTYEDHGMGMKEEVSSKHFYDIHVANHRFSLTVESGCETFRIDPLNTACVLRINCISVRHGGEEQVISYSTNANYTFENWYCFASDDPMLLINTKGMQEYEDAKIIVDFDVVTYDSVCVEKMIGILDILKAQSDKQLGRIEELEKNLADVKLREQKLQKESEELQAKIAKLNAAIAQQKKNRFGMKS